MGLTHQSTGFGSMKEMFQVRLDSPDDLVIALAGNPNTGKSTVFNALTGLNQHTGNWPGKTVTNAQGKYQHSKKNFILVDLPGTYSLLANSVEEEVARDFICFGYPHATVVVADATCLERNLNLALQVMEITDKVIICVNLLDEAKRKKIHVDLQRLSEVLGVPVVGTNARDNVGLEELKETVLRVALGDLRSKPLRVSYDNTVEKAVQMAEPFVKEFVNDSLRQRWAALRLLEGDKTIISSFKEHQLSTQTDSSSISQFLGNTDRLFSDDFFNHDDLRDRIVASIVVLAEQTARQCVSLSGQDRNELDRKIDNILTSKTLGIPIMIILLGVVFWITIQGANYPSQLLATGLFWVEDRLTDYFVWAGLPAWLHGAVVMGVYRTLAWVVSVMLPPMAIFFPLFTMLEDLGYLPRVAFNLDNYFKKACAHGKQALTMCMGFGCNAAGIIACRIIDSPRERLIAMVTNNFVPCNGRFPTLIALATIFIAGAAGAYRSFVAALAILGVIILGVTITLLVSRLLSWTVLKGLPSSFALELPPFRKPQIGRIIIRSIYDRTLFVLGRAVLVAAPAGLITWVLSNVFIGDFSIVQHCARILDPAAYWLGMDGYILMAFILGFPANEIVLPILFMSYMSSGHMIEINSLTAVRELLVNHGWTWLTGVCTMLFCLNHFPCGTTLYTIYKETQSKRWPLVAVLVNTAVGVILCFILAQTARLFGLV